MSSHPTELPDLFLDRSLGSIKVPQLLREAGLRLITLADHYGSPEDEQITDVEWLSEVGRRGWVAFTQDERIRWNRLEREAVVRFGVRLFYLARGDLLRAEAAAWFLDNLPAITGACSESGPCIYAVYRKRIRQVM